jgi:hypothetical protein
MFRHNSIMDGQVKKVILDTNQRPAILANLEKYENAISSYKNNEQPE